VHVSGLHFAAAAAGPDEIRGSGPEQAHALEALTALLGVPISSIDRRMKAAYDAWQCPAQLS